jgi:hypothetical protein
VNGVKRVRDGVWTGRSVRRAASEDECHQGSGTLLSFSDTLPLSSKDAMSLVDLIDLCTDPASKIHVDVVWTFFLTYRSYMSDDECLQLLAVSTCFPSLPPRTQ